MNAKGQIFNNNVFDLQRGHKWISVTSGETQLSSMDLLRPEINSYFGVRWSPAPHPCSGFEMQMAAAGNHKALPRHLGTARCSWHYWRRTGEQQCRGVPGCCIPCSYTAEERAGRDSIEVGNCYAAMQE